MNATRLSTYLPWLVTGGQFLLISICCFPLLYQSDAYVFADDGDGLKNYFTLQSYIQQADSVSLFRYTGQHYPFGDYVFYTDNTPILAVGTRWLGSESNSPLLFNWFICLGMVFSSFLCSLILRRFLTSPFIILAVSLLIPWLSPQAIRLSMGHMNLSLSWIFLLGLWFIIQEQAHQSAIKKHALRLGLFLLLFLSAFIHLYYLLILGVMIGWWYLLRAIASWGKWRKMRNQFIKALLMPLVGVGLVWGIIQQTDEHYDLRRESAGGYNWTGWNLNPDAMYTAYDFQTFPFPLHTDLPMNSEWYSYWGNLLLYGFFIVILLAIFLPGRKSRFKRHFQTKQGRLLILIGLTGLGCWFAALGEYAQFGDGAVKLHNPLTPFFYLSMLTEKVSHFRCMARFNWVFFLTSALILAYCLEKIWLSNQKWKQWLVCILILLGAIDAFDMARHTFLESTPNPLTNEERLSQVKQLLSEEDMSIYQGLLPYPYFHVGSEEYSLTIDPIQPWARTVFQAASVSRLPLFSSILSRTPVEQTRDLLTFSAGEGPIPAFWDQLDDRPILVLISESAEHWIQVPSEELQPARRNFLAGRTMPQRMEMTLLRKEGPLSLYRWDIEKGE